MKNKDFICKGKIRDVVYKIPYVLTLLLMIVICPLGVYFFIIKTCNNKKNMYKKGRNLISAGIFVLFLIGVGIYSHIKGIIELYSSGMSLDMINFVPDNILLYIIGIIIVISYMYGGKYLIKKAIVEQVYTYRINIDHQKSLKRLSDELGASLVDVKNNIKLLQKHGYLVPIEIDNKKNEIIYGSEKNKNVFTKERYDKKIKCKKCGTLVTFKVDEYVECDFCGHGMINE